VAALSRIGMKKPEHNMSNEEAIYERRLNALLFDAANRTEEFVRQKIAIIADGNALQDSYLATLQQCCRKHDEVLKMEEYVLTRFERGLPALQAPEKKSRISPSQEAVERLADHFVEPSFPGLRRMA
jgi:flagellar motor component MotA